MQSRRGDAAGPATCSLGQAGQLPASSCTPITLESGQPVRLQGWVTGGGASSVFQALKPGREDPELTHTTR